MIADGGDVVVRGLVVFEEVFVVETDQGGGGDPSFSRSWRRRSFRRAGSAVQSAVAATIHIPFDYTTIQAGIDASVESDTILIAEGIYFKNGIDFLGKAILVTGADPEDSLEMNNIVTSPIRD